MDKATKSVSDKLLVYLPNFEAGEEITYDNWFMDFYRLALDELCDEHYMDNMEAMGWERLTDVEFINRADIEQLRTILTAVLRSERQAVPGSCWGHYVKAGSFLAILHRLDAIRKEG